MAARPFGAVCANGKTAFRLRIWKGLQYYDTFATVLSNGSYPMAQIMSLPPSDRAAITKVLTQEIDDYSKGPVFPVTSCFGGMAVSGGQLRTPPPNRHHHPPHTANHPPTATPARTPGMPPAPWSLTCH